jgi:hypothetical protein
LPLNYQMNQTYPKWLLNIYSKLPLYVRSNIFLFQGPSKFSQVRILRLKIYLLATLSLTNSNPGTTGSQV